MRLGRPPREEALIRLLCVEHGPRVLRYATRLTGDRAAAEDLGVPPGTVKSRSYHALRAIRAAIGGREAMLEREVGG